MELLSANTKAILLLTAPLIVGKSTSETKLLSAGEYGRLARHLHEMEKQPADLVTPEAADLIHSCENVVPEERLRELLSRGFLLSQAIERWQARAIWVVSRADANYPQKLKDRLRAKAPALLYGCGSIDLLGNGDIAVVGSRDVDENLIHRTMRIGDLSARAHKVIVCGGAKGIDQAAMDGALQGGGNAIGVLTDSLEKSALKQEYRDYLKDGRLVLISPYDPNAGFNVGHAMQRNKVIYGLAEIALVMSSDFEKGGTWAGAIEQLDRLSLVPVFVRAEEPTDGLDALLRKGGIPWPSPQDVEGFEKVFKIEKTGFSEEPNGRTPEIPLPLNPVSKDTKTVPVEIDSNGSANTDLIQKLFNERLPTSMSNEEIVPLPVETALADTLFAAVRQVFEELLKESLKETDIASRLQISTSQVKLWLKRLLNEGIIMKNKRPVGYIARQSRLFK